MADQFVLPAYHEHCLTNVLPSIESRLRGATPILDIPQAAKYVILLVDGLGEILLQEYGDHAEWMSSAAPHRLMLSCAVPSTTATSLSSLGTGKPPGEHGVVGYTFLDPGRDQLLNALTWHGGPLDVDGFRLTETCYERLNQQGHHAAAVSLARFENSGLQQLSFRGARHFGVEDEADPAHVRRLLHRSLEDHDVVYLYERRLDHLGHSAGMGSWQWLEMLAEIDDYVQYLIAGLPGDVALLVTGDHGMVNVPAAHRIVAEEEPLLAGWRHIGGEGRLRQLYTEAPTELALRWGDFLGERAEVRTRAQAIEAGWFGPRVDDAAAARIGDVLVAMRSDWAVMSTTFPKEFSLVGMHGSLTPQEMLVPLLIHGGTSTSGGNSSA